MPAFIPPLVAAGAFLGRLAAPAIIRAAAPLFVRSVVPTVASTVARTTAPSIIRAAIPSVVRPAPSIIRAAIPSVVRPALPAGSTFARTAIGSAPSQFTQSAGILSRLGMSAPTRPLVGGIRIPFTSGPVSSATRGSFSTMASRPITGTTAIGGTRAISSAPSQFTQSMNILNRLGLSLPAGARPIVGGIRIPSATGPVSAATRGATSPLSAAPVSRTFAMGGRGATSSATRGAFSPLERGATSAYPRGEFSQLASQASRTSALRRVADIATGGGNLGTQLAVGVLSSPQAIQKFEETTGVDVPAPVEAALSILAAAAGVRGGRSLAKAAPKLKATEGTGLRAKAARGLGKVAKPAGYTLGAASVLGGGMGALSALSGQPADVAAEDQGPVIPPVEIPEGGLVGPGGGAPAPEPGTPEAEAQTQLEAIDAAFQAAVDELTATYGGVEEALRALETGDPYLAQALATLDSQYRQAQTQVAAAYSAAIGDIAGYQQQADALMQEVAAQQAADFEAAAGGLENIDVGVDPATAAMAAEAGLSDTAVGGGAITGAGLARGLAGAASAEGAASRLRTGSELSGALTAARRDAAAQQAALTQNYLGQRYQAEVEAAMAEAERRQAIEDALIQNKIAQGEALSQIELQRAQQIAALSPQDYAAASGATQTMTNPRWFGAALEGDMNAPVPGLKKTIEDPVSGNPRSVDATVSDVNMLVDQLSAASAVARQLYTQNSPADAYAHLADFYNRVPNPTWFSSLGIPTTAYEAYVDLFGQPPF